MTELLRRAARLTDAAVARLESSGGLDPLGTVERRRFLALSATALASTFLAACGNEGPRSAQPALRFAERRNEAVERWLLRHARMGAPVDAARPGARAAGAQYPAYYVSPVVPTWDTGARGPWMLEVTGLVERPLTLSLEALVRLPHVKQRINHYCVEGWNAVATYWGVPMRDLARMAGVRPEARYVDFQSFDEGYHESWDVDSALHPQTVVAYAKDGHFLPAAYGAPARVFSPVKLGYKNTKYLTRIVFAAERNGGYWSDRGYEWFGGT